MEELNTKHLEKNNTNTNDVLVDIPTSREEYLNDNVKTGYGSMNFRLPLPTNRKAENMRNKLVKLKDRDRSLNLWYLPSYDKEMIKHGKSIKSKTTVFLIHGSMANGLQYTSIVGDLMKLHYNIVVYDLYGCGASEKPHKYEAYNTLNHLEDLIAVYNMYNTEENILIGHSYGTSLIGKFIRFREECLTELKDAHDDHVDKVDNNKVILLGTAFDMEKGAHPIFKLPVCILNCLSSYLSDQFIKLAFSEATVEDNKKLMQMYNKENDMTVCKYFYQQFEWASADEWKALSTVDVLILQGKDDKITPTEKSDELFHFLQSNQSTNTRKEYKVLDECGHMILMEKSTEISELIAEFLKDSLE